MKRSVIIISLLQLLTFSTLAQPSWVKKATKSVFTLKTFDADGSLMGSATGFYVGQQGEGVSSFSPFRGAARAIVIDADGKEYPAE